MQRLTLFATALVVTAGAALGQPPGPPAGGPFAIERLAVLLELDAYQKQEVERVLTEQREARRAAREERAAATEPPSREDVQARRVQDREQLLDKLRNTLSAEQLEKLDIVLDMQPGGRGPRGGAPF